MGGENKAKEPAAGAKKVMSVGVLALVSAAFPGAAQFANGENSKGIVIVGLSLVLMAAFFFQLAEVIGPFFNTLQQGQQPFMDDAVIRSITPIGWILGVGIFIWLYAMVDAVIVAKKQQATSKEHLSQ